MMDIYLFVECEISEKVSVMTFIYFEIFFKWLYIVLDFVEKDKKCSRYFLHYY